MKLPCEKRKYTILVTEFPAHKTAISKVRHLDFDRVLSLYTSPRPAQPRLNPTFCSNDCGTPYTRWFGQNGEAKAQQRDLAMPTRELQTEDKLTVSVENIFERDGTKYIRLSNVLDLSLPPASAPSSAIRILQVVK